MLVFTFFFVKLVAIFKIVCFNTLMIFNQFIQS